MVFERFILAPFATKKEKLGLFPASLSFSFIPQQTPTNDFFIAVSCGYVGATVIALSHFKTSIKHLD